MHSSRSADTDSKEFSIRFVVERDCSEIFDDLPGSGKLVPRPRSLTARTVTRSWAQESETGNRGQLIYRYKKRAGATVVLEGRQRTADLSSTSNLSSSRGGWMLAAKHGRLPEDKTNLLAVSFPPPRIPRIETFESHGLQERSQVSEPFIAYVPIGARERCLIIEQGRRDD